MARILCAWEIGNGHGHIRNLIASAEILRDAGHQITFAIPASKVTAIKLVKSFGHVVKTFNLPIHPSLNQYLAPLQEYRAASFVDILGIHAFDDVERLRPLLHAYLGIINNNRIDVVLAETAPAAMFASNVAHRPCLGIGTSFGLPEFESGFSEYPQLDNYPNTPLFDEWALLQNAQQAASREFDSLGHCMSPHRIIPFCYPSMDHYGNQRSLTHRGVGPILKTVKAILPEDRRCFAYLQQSYPSIVDMMSAIRRSGIPFRVFVSGGKYQSAGNMKVLDSFDIVQELQSASMILHHGSAGVAQAAMTAGVPQSCLPYHIENANNAYRLQLLGVSKGIGHQQQNHFMEFLLEEESSLIIAAQTIADQLSAHAAEFGGARVAAAAVDDLL